MSVEEDLNNGYRWIVIGVTVVVGLVAAVVYWVTKH